MSYTIINYFVRLCLFFPAGTRFLPAAGVFAVLADGEKLGRKAGVI
jgi:hypothetical protein